MKIFFNILKSCALFVLLITVALGYLFFQTWQKNERPEVLQAQWEKSEVPLGDSATLEVTLRAPWHRKIISASPLSYPEHLLPVPEQASFRKGTLSLNGQREWSLSIPLVATAETMESGLSISLPLARTQRISPSSVTIPLPPLSIISPNELPRDPNNPNAFLLPEAPAPAEKTTPASAGEERYGLIAALLLLALLLVLALFFLLRRSALINATPPWEKALIELKKLDHSENATLLLAKLTDILKQYTSERFQISASAKTSTEFLASVQKIDALSEEELADLPWLARTADAAKFAGKSPSSEACPRALTIVQRFVEKTTPQENPDA